MSRLRAGRTRAQAMVFMTMMLPLFLAVVGLALDGGYLFAERATLQAIADASARAGAVHVDTARMYREGTGIVVLNPGDAIAAAQAYAQYQGLAPEDVQAQADDQVVSVQVSRTVPTVFVRIVNIDSLEIHAAATAHARYGIAEPLNGQ